MKRNVSRNVLEQSFQNILCIDYELFARSMYSDYLHVENNFIDYIKHIFSPNIVSELYVRFRIGSSKYWKGSTVFWQIDKQEKIRSGKIILYDKKTGKRFKNTTWVYSALRLQNYNLKQCSFSLHQINKYQNQIIRYC